jgi:hypothetical protein
MQAGNYAVRHSDLIRACCHFDFYRGRYGVIYEHDPFRYMPAGTWSRVRDFVRIRQ